MVSSWAPPWLTSVKIHIHTVTCFIILFIPRAIVTIPSSRFFFFNFPGIQRDRYHVPVFLHGILPQERIMLSLRRPVLGFDIETVTRGCDIFIHPSPCVACYPSFGSSVSGTRHKLSGKFSGGRALWSLLFPRIWRTRRHRRCRRHGGRVFYALAPPGGWSPSPWPIYPIQAKTTQVNRTNNGVKLGFKSSSNIHSPFHAHNNHYKHIPVLIGFQLLIGIENLPVFGATWSAHSITKYDSKLSSSKHV